MAERCSAQRKEVSTNTFVLPCSLQDLVFQMQWEFRTVLVARRSKMWRTVCPSSGDHAGAGTPTGRDHGAIGLFYANTVGAFGAASAGRNWDRLSSEVHRWALKLVVAKEVFILLFSGDTLFLAEGEISEESFLVITFS